MWRIFASRKNGNCHQLPVLCLTRHAQTVSGVLWTVSMAIASGFFERSRGDILAACDFEVNSRTSCAFLAYCQLLCMKVVVQFNLTWRVRSSHRQDRRTVPDFHLRRQQIPRSGHVKYMVAHLTARSTDKRSGEGTAWSREVSRSVLLPHIKTSHVCQLNQPCRHINEKDRCVLKSVPFSAPD